MEPLVRLEDVTKSYFVGETELKVLKGVDLEMPEGGMISVRGPSGSGKTTLLNIIGLLDLPTSGHAFYRGADTREMDGGRLRRILSREIGWIFQQSHLIPRLTVLQNVELPMAVAGRSQDDQRERATRLIRSVNMDGRIGHRADHLSPGERQRVGIARALANDPTLIVADEPTGELDRENAASVMEIFRAINESGKAIAAVTHDPELASGFGTRLALVSGRLEPSPPDPA